MTTNAKKIRVATRPSKLAYTQTMQTVELLKKSNPDVEFEVLKFSTKGDRDQTRSLTQFGGTGLFVKELENALLEGEADIAIHSLKDVPSEQPAGLSLVAFPPREDPRDVLITDKAREAIQTIGTGSPRRVLQLRQLHKHYQFLDIRGNIDTRIAKQQEGNYDAIILAAAGLNRLGVSYDLAQALAVTTCIPAVGQGAIAIECREADSIAIACAKKINHAPTHMAVSAERAFMKTIEGGCKFPLAAHAYYQDEELRFLALVGDLKTGKHIRKELTLTEANAHIEAAEIAAEMLEICQKEHINLYTTE